MGYFIVPDDDNDNDNKASNYSSIRGALLNSKDMVEEFDTNMMLHSIKTKLENANESLESPQINSTPALMDRTYSINLTMVKLPI